MYAMYRISVSWVKTIFTLARNEGNQWYFFHSLQTEVPILIHLCRIAAFSVKLSISVVYNDTYKQSFFLFR